ncbi:MFS transporter [Quadrisphaera sp. DSM 44207]|uniref:MFS transporter n=1 Tax=Quadrisphaera sp. DSM 44207 TaxID=1881057 RepID=UPI000891DF1F|nr:MFS transporter [Quadrisphaera sp. DSM 44207]SDQ39891.1 MFS transporter, UMF1 family [Quadrisphaera sp. DSM 44207]
MSAPALRTREAARRRQQRAWYVYDWANSGYVTTTATVLFTPYLTAVAEQAACPGGAGEVDGVCRTPLSVLGLPVAPGSLALYVVTAATLLSAVLLPVVGALADRSPAPRRLLGRFAWTGATAAAAMVLVADGAWQLGAVLQLVATVGLTSSLVVYDALLVQVAGPDERDRVSSRGWALGYAGGGLLLALDLALVLGHDALGLSEAQAVRASLLTAGLWWAVFTIVPYRGLRGLDARGPAIRRAPQDVQDGRDVADVAGAVGAAGASRGRAVARAFVQLGVTLRHARAYPQTLLFLVAYLFFNDGVQTVIGTASLYGQAELGFRSSDLIIAILLVQFVALGGALLFGRIAGRAGARRTVLGGLVVWLLVVVAGFALPAGRFGPFLLLAAGIGLVLGGTQALSRSLYSQLVPRGQEAEYFSLYQAAERGTSWLGTFVFGLVFQLAGSYRPAILSLVVFFLVGGVLLWRVDVRRGVADAGNPQPTLV